MPLYDNEKGRKEFEIPIGDHTIYGSRLGQTSEKNSYLSSHVMLNYTYLYEETYSRCKQDYLCKHLVKRDLASILNDIFNFTVALETHHKSANDDHSSKHAQAAKDFSSELIALLNHQQHNKIRYMYFCDQLGSKIAEITHGSEDEYISSYTKSRVQPEYCKHATNIYQDMYEATKDQEMRVVVYDESEVYSIDQTDP